MRNFVCVLLCSLVFLSASGPQDEDRGGFVYDFPTGFNRGTSCNGAFVSKVPKLSPKCEFGVLTAAHCIKGVTKFSVDSVSYDLKEVLTLRDNDVALAFFEASCERFEDEKVSSINSQIVPDRSEVTVRKSHYWTRQLASLGYGSDTPNVGGKQIRGMTLSSYEGKTLPGFRYFLIAGNDTIEKGDSGAPIFRNGSIVGVASGGRAESTPPYSVFLFAGQEAMEWAVKELLDRYRHLPIRTRR